MARRRTVGFVQLEWTCPNCSTRNPGGRKTCVNCGAPQPENVQFEQPAEAKLVSDEAAVRAAKGGADIHCPFCGTRNPASAKVCSQCGGDLVEGRRRMAGQVMQAAPTAPKTVTCRNCGTENPAANTTCSRCGSPLPRASVLAPAGGSAPATQPVTPPKKNAWLPWAILAGVAVLICAVVGFALFAPTASLEATVDDVYWQTSVPLQEIQSVWYSNEPGSPPSDAYDVSCDTRSRDVCEQKMIDRGNGYAEVVEDCRTETEQYCDYRRDEWRTLQTYTEEGHSLAPFYAQPSYSADQRLGSETVDYTVYFQTVDGTKTYSPDDLNEFQRFSVGSVWILKLNALGSVVGVER